MMKDLSCKIVGEGCGEYPQMYRHKFSTKENYQYNNAPSFQYVRDVGKLHSLVFAL